MRWAEDKAKTASHEHYREICAECRTVISQCRCRSASKVEKLGLCDSCDPESAEKQATLYQQAVDEAVWDVVAVKRKPSFPNLVDEYEPTDPALWERVLEVASGDRRDYTQGDRTINSPNDGRGYRGMPSNPKGIAWAVKQYKGFDGNFRKQADAIPGGLADKGAPKGLDKKELAMGIEVEMEHTNDKAIAKEIALDHLTEDPKYYTKLKKVEKHASWEARLARMEAGGIEVTHGPDPEAKKLASEGKIRLAGSDGLRWYWDLAYPDQQVQASTETKEAEVSGVCGNGPAARWAD